jgi:very-short-patch-repair endonuclease
VLEERAARMRHEATPSEQRLFEALRGGRLGVAFRRQVPLLGRYIADLLAPQVRLVVEVDGGYHAERERADARRDRALAAAGYRVLRLEAEMVMRDAAAAVALVRAEVERSLPLAP